MGKLQWSDNNNHHNRRHSIHFSTDSTRWLVCLLACSSGGMLACQDQECKGTDNRRPDLHSHSKDHGCSNDSLLMPSNIAAYYSSTSRQKMPMPMPMKRTAIALALARCMMLVLEQLPLLLQLRLRPFSCSCS